MPTIHAFLAYNLPHVPPALAALHMLIGMAVWCAVYLIVQGLARFLRHRRTRR